jgi:L-asparaginase
MIPAGNGAFTMRRIVLIACGTITGQADVAGRFRPVGGATELLAKVMLPVGNLQPLKARLRLVVGLALGLAPAAVFPVD